MGVLIPIRQLYNGVDICSAMVIPVFGQVDLKIRNILVFRSPMNNS